MMIIILLLLILILLLCGPFTYLSKQRPHQWLEWKEHQSKSQSDVKFGREGKLISQLKVEKSIKMKKRQCKGKVASKKGNHLVREVFATIKICWTVIRASHKGNISLGPWEM